MSQLRHITVEIGGTPIRVCSASAGFLRALQERYAAYLSPSASPAAVFEVELVPPCEYVRDLTIEFMRVEFQGDRWHIARADFDAEWQPASRVGKIVQPSDLLSVDSVLRVVHTLLLVSEGGFLLHASSAVRNGRAHLFSGVSGAGKTTFVRLAPPGVNILGDEIAYVRRVNGSYAAFGTPFCGELNRPGDNISAPVAGIYFLAQGSDARLDDISPSHAAKALLRNILFFAEDRTLVARMFAAACEFLTVVPARRLTFPPRSSAWDLIA